ncbi:MAG: DUF302 domain-containing protein [Hyphomicrobium sp.]
MALRPTQLLLFGNAKGGTPLMQDEQAAGIDLPLKALAFEDENGRAWLSYNDPAWIAQRHGLGEDSKAAVDAMALALATLPSPPSRANGRGLGRLTLGAGPLLNLDRPQSRG